MVKVKIQGISCSPRHANTEVTVKWALDSARELPGVETELISLVGKEIKPCNMCYRCVDAPKDNPCPGISDDDFREIALKMAEADGYVIGTYADFHSAASHFHILKGRLMSFELSHLGHVGLRCKVVGATCVGMLPNGGQNTAILQVLSWAIENDMYVVMCGPEKGLTCGGNTGACGSTCSLSGCAEMVRNRSMVPVNSKEEKALIMEDEVCKIQSQMLGKRIAETAKVIKAGYAAVPREELQWAYGPISGGYQLGGGFKSGKKEA